MEVHQFHSTAAVRDALLDQMLSIRALLREGGHRSEIYVLDANASMAGDFKPFAHYEGGVDDVLLVHHSIGFDAFSAVVAKPGRKVLCYHNVPPEQLLSDPDMERKLRQSRSQLAAYRPHVAYALADSNFDRRELLARGYSDVGVLPAAMSLDAFCTLKPDPAVLRELQGSTNWLFVGRIEPSKRQEDVIRAFVHYRRAHDPTARLFLVGADREDGYVHELKALGRELCVEKSVRFVHKASARVLKAYYLGARLFLCLSEHEGFCVPLLEAMAANVPVIAFRTMGIAETMAGAGILTDTRDPAEVGELATVVLWDEELRQRLLVRQRRRIVELRAMDTRGILRQILQRVTEQDARPTLRLDGPFETSYSLAIVNRKLIEALHRRGRFDVSYSAADGYGDYVPKTEDLADKPLSKALYEAGRNIAFPDLALRDMYPPRVSDMRGGLNVMAPWGWEETRVPGRFVTPFNRYLDGMGVMSRFVKEALETSGVNVPITVTGVGVELPEGYTALSPLALGTSKPFRFLHISSAFPRKGVDVLIAGYFEAFTGDDPVVLVLKTFPNPHNEVKKLLADARQAHPNPPEVVWLDFDMPEREFYALYKAASCYVHVARGEGFGLPVAEAMLARVPVIVSPNTGLADFCSEETAVLVPFKMVPACTHLSEGDSLWAEPDAHALSRAMRDVACATDTEALTQRVEMAHRLISTKYNWDAVSARVETFIDWLRARNQRPKIALVSTWGVRCGIAEYSRFLAGATGDRLRYAVYASTGGDLVAGDHAWSLERCWQPYRPGDILALAKRLAASDEDVLHVHYNFGFFSVEDLGALVDRVAQVKPVLVTFHSTKDVLQDGRTISLRTIRTQLAQASALIVHQHDDRARLEAFGLGAICRVMPQGNVTYPKADAMKLRSALRLPAGPIIATFGFLMPHKGVMETIQATGLLRRDYPDVVFIAACALHSNPDSSATYRKCLAEIRRLRLERHVILLNEFLAPEECLTLLQTADVTVLPYQYTQESSSAAVRFCLAAGRPLVTSKERIFDEVAGCTHQIDEATPAAIAGGVRRLLGDASERERLIAATKARVHETSWASVGELYAALVESLLAPDPFGGEAPPVLRRRDVSQRQRITRAASSPLLC